MGNIENKTILDLPKEVQRIDSKTFEGCPNVETFVVYGDYIAQGDSVYDQEDVYYNGYGEIIFGESCHFIGSAHQKIQIQYRKKCEKKGIVKIPEGITYISTELMNCEEITEVILPKSLERIYYLAFGGCGKLTDIILPKSVKQIEENAFDGCTCLKRVGTREQLQNMRKEASHLMYRPFERLQDVHR